MDYEKHYNLLVFTRKNLNRKREKHDGFHNHHVIPKSLGGDNSESNLVLLTPKEHFIAHLLLLMMYKNVDKTSYRKMVYAFWNMCGRSKIKAKNSRAYQFAVESNRLLSVWVKRGNEQKFIPSYDIEKYISDGWLKGRLPHSEETINSIRNSKNGSVWIFKGCKQKNINEKQLEDYLSEGWAVGRVEFTESHKENIKRGLTGRDLSDSHRKNIGNSLKGREISPKSEAHKRKLGKPIMFNGVRYDGATWAAKALNTTKLKIFNKLRDKESIDCYYL